MNCEIPKSQRMLCAPEVWGTQRPSRFLNSCLAIGLDWTLGLKRLAFIFAIAIGNSGIHPAQALRSWVQPG